MRKNILIFGHSYATQFIDISNQYTRLFDQNKYNVIVVYLVGEPNAEAQKKHLADQVLFLNSPKKSTRGLKIDAIRKILKLCRENPFEIVICHRYKPTYIMLCVEKLIPIPTLISVMHELGTLRPLMRKIFVGLFARKNIIFAGVSNAVRDDMRKSIWRVAPERVITLYNMIDVDLTKPQLFSKAEARRQLNLDESVFVFGHIGRLAKNKDQKTLIQAFANTKNQCPHSKLIILGDGVLKDELTQLAQTLNCEKDVIFAGYVKDAFRYMMAFDVFISTSIQEAFGRVLLEAMIAKIPIIATRVNGIPEVIDTSGSLINAGNSVQLAAEMLKAFKMNPIWRAKWGQNGYDRVMNHFSLKQFNQIFWELPIIQRRDNA